MMRVLIVGAGAVGSYFAAQLHRAGHDVTLLARGARLAHLRANGLQSDAGSRVESLPVSACDWASLPDAADYTILALKTCDLAAALEHLAAAPPALRRNIVTVQNGIDAPDDALRVLPGSMVLAARMHGFVEMAGDVVRHVGVPVSLAFGTWKSSGERAGDVETRFAQMLRDAGIGAEISADIESLLWVKFLLAASLGATAAAYALPAGDVLADAAAATHLRAAMEDMVQLAARRGVHLPDDAMARTLDFIASFPTGATTSLQRDLAEGRRSEYAALPGAVLRMAVEEGVDLPQFAALDRMIRQRGLQ